MKRTQLLMITAMLFFTSLFAYGASAKAANNIGFKKYNVAASKAGQAFPVALIFPTHTPDEVINVGSYSMRLAKDAVIAPGKYPLVVISHGSKGSNLAHRSIAFDLVKAGFMVAAPVHPSDNFQNSSASSTKSWHDRPNEISQTLDVILADKAIAKYIDQASIAVLGYAAGGYTALAAVGAHGDTEHLIKYCRQSKYKSSICQPLRAKKLQSKSLEFDSDERIKAIVLMAPVGVLFQAENALEDVNVPTLLLQAEKDQELLEPYHSKVIVNNFANKSLLTYCVVPNAGHYSFITPFPTEIKDKVGVMARDPKGFNRSKFHQQLSEDIRDYLQAQFYPSQYEAFSATSCQIN